MRLGHTKLTYLVLGGCDYHLTNVHGEVIDDLFA
jgi:hypothetical protein